jgi:phage-related protein
MRLSNQACAAAVEVHLDGESGAPLRPLLWVASSKRDYRRFPPRVQDEFGFALFLAQTGQHPPSAKILRGFGSGVVELVEDFDGDTYRAVYTVRFSAVVYVLHAFKKKSKRGAKTPQTDIDLIRRRLVDAERDYGGRF